MKLINSFFMKAVISLLFILVNIISVYLLLRGHNFPGGGFIAGLVTGISFILLGLVRGWTELQRELPLPPLRLATFGVMLAILTGAAPMLFGKPFLTQTMIHLPHIPFFGELHIGTPFLFDFGVFLLVSSITVKLVIVLARSTSGMTALTPGEALYYASVLEETIEGKNMTVESLMEGEEDAD